MDEIVKWGQDELKTSEIRFEFDESGIWQGPWISLKPGDRARVYFDRVEREYFAINNLDALKALADLNKNLSIAFPSLERLQGMIYDPASPWLDDYNDYLVRYHYPEVRSIIAKYSLPPLSWKFQRLTDET